jgi:hypothetical protein
MTRITLYALFILRDGELKASHNPPYVAISYIRTAIQLMVELRAVAVPWSAKNRRLSIA